MIKNHNNSAIRKALLLLLVLTVGLHTISYSLSIDTSSHKITIVNKKITLQEIFNAVQKQTGLRIVTNSSYIDLKQVFNLNVHNQPLETLLNSIFENKGIDYKITNDAIWLRKSGNKTTLGSESSTQDDIIIYGKVTDSSGRPLPLATVKQQGTSLGTTTDDNGAFSLRVTSRKNIIISFTGYVSQIISPSGASAVTIRLQQDIQNVRGIEVYSTGYQQIPKERATGSFDLIDNKLFNQQVTTNVLDRLEPIASGLQVNKKINGGQGQILIRGLSSIQGPQSPLIIVDNFQYDGDINNINPNNVQNITILKDAAAASIWGAKAGNGVIVITTKKPVYRKAFSLDVASSVTIAQKPDLFKLKTMSSSDYIDVEEYLFKQGAYTSEETNPARPSLSPVVEILIAQRDGKITSEQATQQLNALRNHDVRNDYLKYMYRNAVNQQYSINLQGGSDNLAWLLTGGYDRNLDEVYAKNDRVSINSQNTYKPIKNLELRGTINYTKSTAGTGRPRWGDILPSYGALRPYTELADNTGNPIPFYNLYRKTYIDTAGNGNLEDWHYYPLTDYKHVNTNFNQQDIVLSGSINYRLFSTLNLSVNYQYEKQSNSSITVNDEQSFYTRNLINLFTQVDKTTGILSYPIPKGGIYIFSNTNIESKSVRPQLSLNKNISNGVLNAIVGMEVHKVTTDAIAGNIYGYQPTTLSIASVNYLAIYNSYINNAPLKIPNQTSLSANDNRFVSYFFNGSYSYRQRYTLSASARTDASNIFGVHSNDRWNPLWSTGAAWEISNENFYDAKLFPYLKLRATYGYSGNVSPTLSAVTVLNYSTSPNQYTNTPYSNVSAFYNPDLRWEKVGMFNIGIDFSSKNDIISGSIEFYHKKATDLYGLAPVDYTQLPVTVVMKNAASMKGTGFDIQLHTKNIDKAVKWQTTLNFSRYIDKVTSYYINNQTAASLASPSFAISPKVGRPLYGIFAFKWAGLDPKTGDPQGILNGQKSTDYISLVGYKAKIDELIYSGPAIAPYYGALMNTISYAGVSLSFNLLYKFGYYFHRSSISYSDLTNGGAGHSDYAQRWQKTGDELKTDVPSLNYPSNIFRDQFYASSKALVEKGDNIRLAYLNISYQLPNRIFKKTSINNLIVFINANNLGVIWKANRLGIDPDYPDSSLPPSKNFAIGLKANL